MPRSTEPSAIVRAVLTLAKLRAVALLPVVVVWVAAIWAAVLAALGQAVATARKLAVVAGIGLVAAACIVVAAAL